jgi:hypothetical protein
MAKGGAFEREICKRLSLWWTDGEDDSCFWRTSNSGGRATVRGKQGKKTSGHYGDVAATDERGKPFLDLFTIEIKRGYNRCTSAELLDKPARAKAQQYETWIAKAREDSAAAGSSSWMLIHKRDQREAVVFIPKVTSVAIDNFFKDRRTSMFVVPRLEVVAGKDYCVGILLSSFFGAYRPKDLIEFSKSY